MTLEGKFGLFGKKKFFNNLNFNLDKFTLSKECITWFHGDKKSELSHMY